MIQANVIAMSGRAVEAETLRLAEKLGAETAVLSGDRPSDAILQYARRRNISKIVLGKPIHSRWRDALFDSVRDDLERNSGRAGETVTYLFDTRAQAVAQWVYDHGRMAGKTTDTLPAAKGLYLPLRTSRGTVGVLGVHPADPRLLISPDRLHLLEAFANQIALAVE